MTKLLLFFLLFSFPCLSQSAKPRAISAGSLYDTLPQIADGESWRTSVILVNLEKYSVSWTVKFFGDDGKPKEFTLVGRGKSSVFAGVLPAEGSITLETPGVGALIQGWAEVSSSGIDDVAAMVVFGTSGIPGRPDYEASVPAVFSIDDDALIPFDNTNGFVTSLAVLNPGTYSDSVIDIKVLDEAGIVVASEKLTLKAGNKLAFRSIDRWSASNGKRGVIVLKGDGLSYLSSFALRFNPGGAFTTVLPMSR